jgi:hypothetical protein
LRLAVHQGSSDGRLRGPAFLLGFTGPRSLSYPCHECRRWNEFTARNGRQIIVLIWNIDRLPVPAALLNFVPLLRSIVLIGQAMRTSSSKPGDKV